MVTPPEGGGVTNPANLPNSKLLTKKRFAEMKIQEGPIPNIVDVPQKRPLVTTSDLSDLSVLIARTII